MIKLKCSVIAAYVLACASTVTQASTFTSYTNQGFGTDDTEPFPAIFTPVSSSDLANSDQDTFLSLTGIDTGGRGDTVARLFDGVAGVGSGFEAQFNTGSVTVNFDISVNSHGYDITGVNTYAAWNTGNGGRSDQEYTLTAILVDDTEREIDSGTFYSNTATDPNENGEVNVWTEVKFSDASGVIQKGVKALRFDFATGANAGGTATYTEFDILGAPSAAPRTFVHPSIGYTLDDLDSIKANLGVEPWKSGYELLLSESQSSLDYVMQGPFAGVGRSENANQWRDDMRAVRNMAFIWYVTGDEAYAQKAHDILIAWATGHTEWLPGETYLTMGYDAYLVFEGADLLRGAWSGWTQSDTDTCKTYFQDVWLGHPNLHVPGPMRSANQGMSQFNAALPIAIFNEDEEFFDDMLHIFRTDASSALPSSLPNGQVGDSGRDAHDQGQIMLWARAAEMFWQQGVDVYSEYDNRMLAAGEYLSRANLGLETPFISAGTVYDIYSDYHFFNIDATTGQLTGGRHQIPTDMLTFLYTAYVTRQGMSAPYLEKYMSLVSPGLDFLYLTPADSSNAQVPNAVREAAEVASVTSMQTANMGDATGGSVTYSNGTWTVSGRGSRLDNGDDPDFRFVYLPVTGDATLLAKLESFSGGGETEARAGLFFTESLENSDKTGGSVFTAPDANDNLETFYRGHIASSHLAASNVKNNQGHPRLSYWLKVERIGNRVTFYNSPDGANWSTSHVADFDMGGTAYYGLAVSSDNNNNEATAIFTDVRITNGDGGEASEIPEAPFAVYASPAGDEIPLRWLESFEADSYKVWRSTQSGGPYTLLTEQSGTSFIDTSVTPYTYYYYAVSAVNSVGESPLSSEESLRFIDERYIEAEDFDAQSGVTVSEMGVTEDVLAGQQITDLTDGDWTLYEDVFIPLANPTFRVRAATFDDIGYIEVRVGSATGTLIGSVTPNTTGRDLFWLTTDTSLSVAPGTYDLYLVYKAITAGASAGINLNWFDLVYPSLETLDLSSDLSVVFDPTLHDLSNDFGISAWNPSLNQLNLQDGSDFSGFDFSVLGLTSWETTAFNNASITTNWDGASLRGMTLISDGNFGAGDSFRGADFSNIVWGAATSTADASRFFSGGSGATSAADRESAISFSGADLSLITGSARSIMLSNLGGFDGNTAIGARYDMPFLVASGWNQSDLIAAGWQFEAELIIDVFGYDSATPPVASTVDLAQTYYLSSSATGGEQADEHATLFNGSIGNDDGDTDDSGEVRLSSENTVTVVFDTSVNTEGYDLTGITSYFGWNTAAGGRSNQGYEVILTYVDGTSETFAGPEHWAPNDDPSSYWTEVSFTMDDSSAFASGVESVTFDITHNANAGSFIVAREIDIFGKPTLGDGLVAHWTMDEGSGVIVADASGQGFDATQSNATQVTGVSGNALAFNGSSSTVTLPPAAFDSIDDEMTLSMWVYGAVDQPKADSIFFATNNTGSRVLNIHLPWNNGQVYWDAGFSGTYDRINLLASQSDYREQWNLWTFSKNATTGEMAIYLNGQLWHSGTGKTRSMAGITAASLGSQISGFNYSGTIDDVMLYNVSLSASEVSDLFESYTLVNGVPASWLMSFGIDPTDAGALADSDGDGLANWEEFAAGSDPLVNENAGPDIRVTEYYLTTGDFSGTQATLTLDQDLADDYFILVRGSRIGSGLSEPDNDYARITGVPGGSTRYPGNLVDSADAGSITLSRAVADFDWEGVVTVVECSNPSSPSGFELVDALSTQLTGTSGTDVSASWNDVDQVVLFGGYRGGGARFIGVPTSRNQGTSVYTRIFPTGSNTLNWSRDAGGETLVDAEMTTFVVEWGADWTVQHANVAGSSGGNGADVVGEYTTSSISPVIRDNTWVWGTGTRADAGIGDSAEACLVTLGDGVNQNTSESTVAVGSEYTDAFSFDVFTLTHSNLAVDYRFKADGDSGLTDLAVVVDTTTDGTRMGWVYNGVNGTGTYFSRPRMWARYTSDTEVTVSRGFSGQDFPAWLQGVDFSGINN